MGEHQPLLATLLADMSSLANATDAACDSAAQSKLTSSKDELALALTAIEHALEHKAELLLQSTGEVYDIGTSNTTANVTAPAPSSAATTVAAIEITVAGTTVAAPMTTAGASPAASSLAAATAGPTTVAATMGSTPIAATATATA